MAMSPAQDTPTAMIDRVASLLKVLDSQQRCSLAQISRQAQVPRSSAHRILQRLVELGWVERDGFQYSLGIRMFELGVQALRRDKVHDAALPIMHALFRSTGLTVYLSILDTPDVLHVERIGGRPEYAGGWQLGARQPAVHSAAGWALLARLDEASWSDLRIPPPATAGGIGSTRMLRRELYRVRDRGGVAVDAQSCVVGTGAVAAPVGPPGAGVNAALTLCGPAHVIQANQTAAAVRTAAMEIWHACAGGARPRRARVPAAAGIPVRSRALLPLPERSVAEAG
jgi:DNA-binding IclR family transcriptional regulator